MSCSSNEEYTEDEDNYFNQIPVLSEVELEQYKKDNKHEGNTNANKYMKIEKQIMDPVMEGYKIDQEIWKYRTWKYNFPKALTKDMIPKPTKFNPRIHTNFYFTDIVDTINLPIAWVERKYKAGAVFDLMSKYPLRDVFIYTDTTKLTYEDLNKTFNELINEGKIKSRWDTISFFKKTWLIRLFSSQDFP
jgi:hypothetical protein